MKEPAMHEPGQPVVRSTRGPEPAATGDDESRSEETLLEFAYRLRAALRENPKAAE